MASYTSTNPLSSLLGSSARITEHQRLLNECINGCRYQTRHFSIFSLGNPGEIPTNTKSPKIPPHTTPCTKLNQVLGILGLISPNCTEKALVSSQVPLTLLNGFEEISGFRGAFFLWCGELGLLSRPNIHVRHCKSTSHKFHADRDHAMCNIQNRTTPNVKLTEHTELTTHIF
jgi:hypothetical protein